MGLPTFEAYAPATLVGVTPAADEQAWLELDPPPGFLDAYERPGQFCRMSLGEEKGIFAMFSAPGQTPVRFLVRVGNPAGGGECADAIVASPVGIEVQMTPPTGAGFDLTRARGRDVYFVATGTGIAPVRSAIEVVLADRRSYGALRLDHGLKSPGHLAIGDDLERWHHAGVDVVLSHSFLDDDGQLQGVTVQDALESARPDLRDAALVAVGQGAMLKELKRRFVALGGHASRFLTNY